MRRILLLRHAKAVGSAAAGDHARGLNERGRSEALEAGRALAALAPPDLALVSDARRTRETFDRVVEAVGRPIPHRFETALYGAAPQAILAVIAAVPPDVETLLVVGHNPGIGELARRLARSEEDGARGELDAHFPTAAFALIRLDVGSWADTGDGGRLEAFRTPEAWENGR